MALHTLDTADNFSLLAWLQSADGQAREQPPKGAARPMQFRFSLIAAMLDNADDRVRLLWFPAGIWLTDGNVYAEDEVDAHATPTLVWDLITEDANAVADTRKLITGATAGQSAGEGVNVAASARGVYVGERYLVFDPTTAAATPAAGDLIMTLWIARGMATAQIPALTFDSV